MTHANRNRRGLSLVELLVALVILAVTVSKPLPRYQKAVEQSHFDLACANLQAIWMAQRMYWVDNTTFAGDLQTLIAAGLLDASATRAARYTFAVEAAAASSFRVRATRKPASVWSGSVTIDEQGATAGAVRSTSGFVLSTP